MFGTCATGGCEKPSTGFDHRCRFHSVVDQARWLSAEEFDRVRDVLATSAPVTEDERNRSHARGALRTIEWASRDLKRAKLSARKAGATAGQIADAVKRGKAEVKR